MSKVSRVDLEWYYRGMNRQNLKAKELSTVASVEVLKQWTATMTTTRQQPSINKENDC